MKEPTYSVFVRFRRGQRLTLKRSAPLDVALRFASTVRGERFHNPDDVFIIDDASGEMVCEASLREGGTAETFSEPPPASDVQRSPTGQGDEIEAILSHAGPWQLRHTQVTLRGGQRLTSSVERSLGQLSRLMELLQRSGILAQDAEQVLIDTAQAIERTRRVQEILRLAEAKLMAAPAGEVMATLQSLTVQSNAEARPQARKRQARAKR